MTALPPSPFVNSSDVQAPAEDTAAAVFHPLTAAAGSIKEPPSNQGRSREVPAVHQPNTVTAGTTDAFGSDISNISEIFHWARKLLEPTSFVLDEAAFMEAIEEPPIFLRQGFGR